MTDASTNRFAQFGFDDGSGSVPAAPPEGVPTQAKDDDSLTVTRSAPQTNRFARFGFDDGSTPADPIPTSPHPGPLANNPQGDSLAMSDIKGSSTAAIKGVGDTLGFAGNMHRALDYGENWIEGKITGETPEQVDARHEAALAKARGVAASQPGWAGAFSRGAQALTPPDITGKDISDPILARTGEYVPQTEAGRIGMSAVEAGVSALGPGSGAAAAGAPARTIADTAARSVPAFMGSGAAGRYTEDETGSPMAGMVAGLAVPGAGHVAGSILEKPYNAATNYMAPMTRGGQATLAGKTIADAASDPKAAAASLANGPQELVPGSKPTTFQMSGDAGLGQLERRQAVQSPDPFLQRASDQNAARVASIESLQPSGSPADVATHFRTIRDAMDADNQAQLAAAHTNVTDASRAIGGQSSTPESIGTGLRDPLVQARAAVKENENRLWGLVNQDGSVPAGGVAQAARGIRDSVSESAPQLGGEESRILDVASRYGTTQRFGDLKDLRSSITDEIAAARRDGKTQTSRRLGDLLRSVDDALDHGVENQAALEQVAVRRGVMSPEETIEGKLAAQRDEFLARRTALAAGGGASDGAGSSIRSFGAPGGDGAIGQTRGRSGANARAQAVPGQAFSQLDAEDLANYRAATAATRNRAQTFDEGVVGKVLQPGARGGFDRSDALVGKDVFHQGSAGGEDMRAYFAAGGSKEAATEAASASLRQAAIRQDGTFDPKAVDSWLGKHEPALRELPPEVRQQFADGATAQRTYDTLVAEQKARENEFKQGAAKPFLGLTESQSVTNRIGGILENKRGAEMMAELARQTADNPEARDGLRRGVIDYIQHKYMSGEAGTSGTPQIKPQKFSDFFTDNKATLRKLFSEDETNKLSVITNDIERSQRSLKTKLPGQSNTAQDAAAMRSADTTRSILSNLVTQAAASAGGAYFAGPIGAALSWLGPKTVGALRNAGLTRVDNLVTEAMLHPELAKVLMERAPQFRDTGSAVGLAFRLKQLASAQGPRTNDQQQGSSRTNGR